MIQKTYHITDFTDNKLETILAEVATMPEYNTSAQVLVFVFEQNWDTAIIRKKADTIKRKLRKAEIAGITHVDENILEHSEHNTILSFLMFEQRAFSIRRIDMRGKTDSEVAALLQSELPSGTKCVMTLYQRLNRDIGRILEGVGDIPAFGADAAVSGFFDDGGIGYVFDCNGVYQDALLLVIFHGENLQVQLSYNFGWTPVGKTVTVTGIRDEYNVTEIDGKPAAELYETYLGIPYKRNPLSVMNICEFPLISEEHGLRKGRIPYAWDVDGTLHFMAAIHKGEKLRLSYGLPQQIFSQVYDDAEAFRAFEPQALLMIICMNRVIFLQDYEHLEIDAYRSVQPEAAFLHGNAEVYREHGVGGEMHSALVAVGFREGSTQARPQARVVPLEAAEGEYLVPLPVRLMTFMRAVTKDLENTTSELLQLKEHLEDEVEIKTRENESLSLHVVKTLADAIDAKDTYTNGHSGRVATYSREIARRAGYSEKGQNEIFIMGLLHDVGKIGVPDAVINKPGKLTDEEFAEIKKHPGMGARILQNIEEMPKLATGAHWHHERYNGRGYPDGLSGTDIPEEARIIAVADAYDAMTSNRSYRRGMDQNVVREQIEKGKGSQFDPKFADIMIAMIDEDKDYSMREM